MRVGRRDFQRGGVGSMEYNPSQAAALFLVTSFNSYNRGARPPGPPVGSVPVSPAGSP